ncbi:cation transporting ATPase C-terminal domain-containing protein, partial [Legionella pneumophila]|uniref:cation transporting ATPase C-terminal domain-containing protein n=1 Tax=Legionella pneumophila TaxID=446 RepID=UPI0038D11DFF
SFLTPLIESFPPPEFIILKKTIVGGSIFRQQRGSVYIQQRQLTWKAAQGTKAIWIAVIVVTVAQFTITYCSLLQTIFVTESVPFWDGVLIVLTGAVFFAVIEIEKQLRLRINSIRHTSSGKNAHYGDSVL